MNLRLARKRAARAAGEKSADANRTRHGLSKLERDGARREAERASRRLDGAQREGRPSGDAAAGDDDTA